MTELDPKEIEIALDCQQRGVPYYGVLLRYQCRKATEQARVQYEAFREELMQAGTQSDQKAEQPLN